MSTISNTLKASQVLEQYFNNDTFYNITTCKDRIGFQGTNTMEAMEGICKMTEKRDVVINEFGHTIISFIFEEVIFRIVLVSN